MKIVLAALVTCVFVLGASLPVYPHCASCGGSSEKTKCAKSCTGKNCKKNCAEGCSKDCSGKKEAEKKCCEKQGEKNKENKS